MELNGEPIEPGKQRDSRVSVRVALVILLDGKLLLALHEKEGRSYWVFPGGRVQYGETLEACGRRELMEETNLRIRVGHLLYVTDRQSGETQEVGVYFRGYPAGGEMSMGMDPEAAGRHVLRRLALVTAQEFRDLEVLPPEVKAAVREDWSCGFPAAGRYLGRQDGDKTNGA